MPTRIGENGRELKARQDSLPPRAFKYSTDDYFMPLIECGKTPIESQIGGVLRSVVRVVIRRGVEGLAVGVVRKQCVVIAEAFLKLDDSSHITGERIGGILVVLHDQWVYETGERIRARRKPPGELRASQGIGGARGRVPRYAPVPVSVGDRLPVGESYASEGRLQQVGIDGHRQALCVGVDSAQRDGKSRRYLPLNSERRLLRDRSSIVGRIAEQHG